MSRFLSILTMFLCHLIIASTGKVDVSLNSDDNLKNEVQQLLFKMTKLEEEVAALKSMSNTSRSIVI